MDVIVVGAGISGLSCAYELQELARQHGREISVRVLEAAGRIGGKIESRRSEGFLLESAANAWLSSKKEVGMLAQRLGLGGAEISASPTADTRYILHRGRLCALPMGPWAFVLTNLLGPAAKLRILREPFSPAPPGADESVADFVRRRLGPAMLERFVDPFVSGVFAGDPEQMSLASCFPKLHELESRHGGLIRGMFATMRAARAARVAGDADADTRMRAAPGGGMRSLTGGIEQLVSGLRSALQIPPETDTPALRLERGDAAWHIVSERGDILRAEKVVLAAPAYASAEIVDSLDTDLARELAAIPHNSVAVVALGWRREDVPHPLDGYGFLVPFAENRDILGSLWESSVFTGRAPPGHVLTRTMLGGTRRPELVARSPKLLIECVQRELGEVLGIKATPVLSHVVRHPRAIPQYHIGHGKRLERISRRLTAHPGLFLAGNAYRGISVSDCIIQARLTATAVLQ